MIIKIKRFFTKKEVKKEKSSDIGQYSLGYGI